MKSKHAVRKVKPKEKSFSRKAGEAIGTIAHAAVEGKEKLVEVAKSAAEKFSSIKKAVAKKIASKKIKKVVKKKATAVKKSIRKAAKKTAKKTAVKAPKKKAPIKKK